MWGTVDSGDAIAAPEPRMAVAEARTEKTPAKIDRLPVLSSLIGCDVLTRLDLNFSPPRSIDSEASGES